jgi:MYXO-CTERM domain-containing protein
LPAARSPKCLDWALGSALEALDEDPGPGTWHYAVFLAGRGRAAEWWDEVVPGENEGTVTIEGGEGPPDAGVEELDAAPPEIDAGITADAGGPGAGGDDGGCGCRVAGGAPAAPAGARWLALGLFALAFARARRRS